MLSNIHLPHVLKQKFSVQLESTFWQGNKTINAWYKMFNTHATGIQGNKIHMEILAYNSAFCFGEGVEQ